MLKAGRKSCIPCMLLMKKESEIKQRNRSFSLFNWKKVKLLSKVNCPCVSVASAFLLFILPLWKHMAQLQCGSCWTSTYCILRQKDWSLGHPTYILMRAFFLWKMKCIAVQVTTGRKKSVSKRNNVQTWTVFLISPSWLSFSEFIVGCVGYCGLLEKCYGILTAELPLCSLWCVKAFSNSLTILCRMAEDAQLGSLEV